MARLFEYQAKALLQRHGIPTPAGEVAGSPGAARAAAERLDGPVMVKAQAWVTGRAEGGGVRRAATPAEAEAAAAAILAKPLKGFPVQLVLVERQVTISRELYAGVTISDRHRCPVLMVSLEGGTGVEERARSGRMGTLPLPVRDRVEEYAVRNLLRQLGFEAGELIRVAAAVTNLCRMARACEARVAEINPLAVTLSGEVVALDARVSIDDHAVFRHPDLGIEMAREMDRPPTPLERVAHAMMSMDALVGQGLRPANYCDTSGNPPASKVYRAARIILAQRGIDGYFLSGSGAASQEQFHAARGLVKAFREVGLHVPAVLRLGGNGEAEAVAIIQEVCADLPAPVEAYGHEKSATDCAARLVDLMRAGRSRTAPPPARPTPPANAYSFEIPTGRIAINQAACLDCANKPCIAACPPQILELREGRATLKIPPEEAKRGGCIECLACELACQARGRDALWIELPIPGLAEVG
ncbi:MAG: acetate--CoA ligase family protein, partial [candidate division NC10 bacterium]|nr:acetate--CoA ligase family protein [candidate division NC10 bacterium]